MILRAYERAIFKRYLLPQRGEGFIFVATAFSFIEVTLGVAALVIVMSVMNGVRSDLFDKIVGLNGHAVVQGFGGRIDDWQDVLKQAKATPGVTSATPLIEQPLLVTFSGRVEGVLVRGMTVPDIRKNDVLGGKVLQGSLNSLTPGSGNVFAHTIARDEPHPINAPFTLERFKTGRLIDEAAAAAVAH